MPDFNDIPVLQYGHVGTLLDVIFFKEKNKTGTQGPGAKEDGVAGTRLLGPPPGGSWEPSYSTSFFLVVRIVNS